MQLGDAIGRFLGRVEVALAGAEEDLREGEDALARGDAMAARAAAHRVLARVPNAPLGLALLSDACEAAGLSAELTMTLEELARVAPSRAEVWVRLGRARAATSSPEADVRDAFGRALALAESGSAERREALLGLADLDLAAGDGERASLWLARAPTDHTPDMEVRRAEVRLALGDASGAAKLLAGLAASPTDGRAALAHGRALAGVGDASAFLPLIRARVLDVEGASEALSAALAQLPTDLQTRTRVRSVVDAKGEQDAPRWRAAFARAEGHRSAARDALRAAVLAGDPAARGALLEAAILDQDVEALDVALAAIARDTHAAGPLHAIPSFAVQLSIAMRRSGREALDALLAVRDGKGESWAFERAQAIALEWVPPAGAAMWTELLARLDEHAHAQGDEGARQRLAAQIAELAAERSRPVRLAIVGEFNAGKSTFINALVGSDVAPTGVLPTTATLHLLRWAPDPFAKLVSATGPARDRIVGLGDLRAVLKALEPDSLARVEICLPLPLLVRVEILDTPGFNAPDPKHAQNARRAFEEADVAVWLFDATQAMKQTERVVLEEARRVGIPVQVLVNKADRLAPDDLATVTESVRASLEDARLLSVAPPLALSAKRALAGKLGDRAALDASGFKAAEALLDESVMARSEQLKERAMRRRTRSVLRALEEAWTARARAEDARAEDDRASRSRTSQAAAAIEGDLDAAVARVDAALEAVAASLRRDLALLELGRDRAAIQADAALARYRVERAVAVLSGPLADALAALPPLLPLSVAERGDLAFLSRALLRTAASAAPSLTRAAIAALARAATLVWVDRLLAAARNEPEPERLAQSVLRELRAFSAALDHAEPVKR